MIDRKWVIHHYANFIDEDGLFIKTLDLLMRADSLFEIQITEFLSPDLIYVFDQICHQLTELTLIKWGVFSDFERAKLVFLPDYVEVPSLDESIALLEVSYNQKFNTLEHKDALGALMALGIKRNKIGDIVVFEGGFQVAVSSELSSYFENSVDKVGRAGVSIKRISCDQVRIKQNETKKINATVKSLRLDSVIATCYNLSRSQAQVLVQGEKVKVNHQVISKPEYSPKETDLISVRGYGRFHVDEVLGVTKKDRIRIVLSVITR